MNLFMTGDFTLRSGMKSKWKIECDALTPEDWAGLAAMAVEILPPFGSVHGVPRGGYPFEEALEKYAVEDCETVLICEDVCTTGGSIIRLRDGLTLNGKKTIGVCVFARQTPPDWVTPLFQMGNFPQPKSFVYCPHCGTEFCPSEKEN